MHYDSMYLNYKTQGIIINIMISTSNWNVSQEWETGYGIFIRVREWTNWIQFDVDEYNSGFEWIDNGMDINWVNVVKI